MSDALDKAKAAIEAARPMAEDLSVETLPRPYLRLLDIAQTQALVAQAEALERIADRLDFIDL